MEKFPLISVVVPAWNEEYHLPHVLKRLAAQDYPNFELIVVNNNSTDKTKDIAAKYTKNVIFEGKQGLTYARQTGFAFAKGEIIARTDADAYPETNWLSLIYNEFQKHPEASAVTGMVYYSDINGILKQLVYIGFYISIVFNRITMNHHQLLGTNFAVKKEAWQKVIPHTDDSKVHEDMDLSCHISNYGKVVFVPQIKMASSARRLKKDPFFIFKYLRKTLISIYLHHPGHKWHKVV